ncbi:ABC transporter permease [Actinomyces sp. 2119]|uniref:ABC transporter permease n=1 Tax=Actinomyces lilanjuaniae TaxID=2321394 RepID=A0ABN5PM12_9ACTO|nr:MULTISPECIES: ABC transporter permease [Actinomyces]AYD89277.1 ABC transporter permease [Actinomyces lilanjuaniae]RJF40693.1 ABC transporter permease [Actinomyces sp. 2119]
MSYAQAVAHGSVQSAAPRWGRLAEALKSTGGAVIGLVVLVVVLSLVAPGFATSRNLVNIIDQVTTLGIVAIGGTAIIITGGIDLSVGSVMALATMVLGWLSHDGGWPMWAAMVAAALVGTACGAVNGVAVTIAKLPPFIATLAMMSVARGLANLITDGQQIVGYPDWFFSLSSQRYLEFFSVTAVTLVVIAVVSAVWLRSRPSGRALYAIGGGEEVARLAGIQVRRVVTATYAIAGALAGVAGIILATRLDSSQPSAGTGLELDVIAAVVIGGASLTGGVGSISGTVVGVLIIGILRNGLNLLGVSPFIQAILIGLVIAVAVMGDVLRRRN